ncbi:polysaccharide deacetylase family protein [Aurantiacibacter sp. MUD61]|uniref:polysaccharide deacetylase family protein n=1 Tax=Aurantiacibacter sp. MUD61 TaxID=3009083 RepID=UPI0022EFE496|nr:polysaccharide deacetylase family protein [Aurantiacibacter sp. MUD61]
MLARLLLVLITAMALAACMPSPAPVTDAEPVGERRIALTFDDIPRHQGAFLDTDERAEMLRTTLREAGVEQAAFFVNTGKLQERANGLGHLLAYMADGHVMANHAATHPSLSDLSVEEYLAEIDAAEEWLVQLEGHRPWFRYPFLDEGRADIAKRDGVRAGLAARGLTNGYVTVDASDWFYDQAASTARSEGRDVDMEALGELFVESHVEAANFFDDLAVRTIGRSPAHVMLLHEADVTVLFLADLIHALEADGWSIITADEAYADPFAAFAATYDTPSAQGTLTEQVAWERDLPAPRWYSRNALSEAQAEFDRRVLGQIEEED